MSEENDNRTKKEEEESYLKICEKCTKFFTNQQAYDTHIKLKHNQQEKEKQKQEDQEQYENESDEEEDRQTGKKPNKNVPIRSRMLQIQRNQHEDNIYTFLGQLGEKNAQPITSRAEIINFANDQKLTGQTNYSVNKVIRTPYQEPIKCSDQIPTSSFEHCSNPQFLSKLSEEIHELECKIQAEKDKWQLRDPMAPQEETADQFSLMDIKKLISNYPKRNLKLSYPNFSIFLLWLGRICKSPAFKQFYLLLGQYMNGFNASIKQEKIEGEDIYEKWKKFHDKFDKEKIDQKELKRMQIFDQKNAKRFIQYFVQWTQIFRALNI